MTHTAVIGLQWGDEGKGKLVDILAQEHDVVVRYNGGANAGHTVVADGQTYKLHLVPCGAVHGKINVIGNGTVINFDMLQEEADFFELKGRKLTPENLVISDRAHIVTPAHLYLDLVLEMHRKKGKIGTTMQGIGPTYELKAERSGMRVIDLVELSDAALKSKLEELCQNVAERAGGMRIEQSDVMDALNAPENEQLRKMAKGLIRYLHEDHLEIEELTASMKAHRERFGKNVKDTAHFLDEQHRKNKKILFEGAQAALLDIDHGSYPDVTSSATGRGGVYQGAGFGHEIERWIGVTKAYTTRVGSGAFPTKMDAEIMKRIQEKGKEFGATTGRRRDCGWLDLVGVRHAMRVNGITEVAMMKLDVLDDERTIPLCVAYSANGEITDKFPASKRGLEAAKPQYVHLPGWQRDTTHARIFDALDFKAQKYIRYVEAELMHEFGARITYVSVGEKREQTIDRRAA